ncbi:hypothetical protein GCM10025771_33030 [Niveibacterium umoris]|uniref:DUF4124 domain-containing protein n=1 Tax=Niveibacterium umoris TaxID=1193620 RepID=A0A840BH12_9RHOO|nr:DUF4124 domain-containing protein [Niveibacterium umoris]MBB4011504.1 hypothetical protein [Niveibacterium umoris]
MKHLTLVLLFALGAQGIALAGDVYTWKDKNGVVHYADQPPSDVDAKQVRSNAPSSGIGSTQSELTKADKDFKEKQSKQGEADKKTEEAAARKAARDQSCNALRSRIALFEQGGRIATNEGGERVLLSDDQIAAELSKMRTRQAAECK